MNPPGYLTILFSGIALIVSLTSLIITLIQKRNETTRSIRKTLTDSLEAISKINIETNKLSSNKEIDEKNKITLRRNYNSQRRILIAHADFLVNKHYNIATDIDCNLLAGAFSLIGDQEKAEKYWDKTIKKSFSAAIKHMNLRGFGNFLFYQGKFQLAREKFKEAFNLKLANSDDNNMLICDTYIMIASLEKEFGFNEEFNNQITQAIEIQNKIVQKSRKNELHERIKDLL